ncbi:MAG: SdiA-regulated domain-containing protein [Marinifilaceae bacterium]
MGKVRKITVFILGIVCVVLLKSCAQEVKKPEYFFLSGEYQKIPYTMAEPSEKFELKSELREISGLTYYRKKRLLCVNDEKGIVYEYSLKKGEVKKRYKFAKSGDYEGIELVDSVLYVLRSDGKLYAVRNFNNEEIEVWDYRTPLKARNDTEGLGYNPVSGELLIACKSRPGINNQYVGNRTVYAFHPDKQQLDTVPRVVINLEQIRKVLKYTGYAKISVKLLKSVNPIEGDITFQPSAVSVHPLTGNIYLLGSVGKLLMVLNPEGQLLAIVRLDRKIFKQPEGVCFAPDGTMYISNEGKGGKAKILEFKYLR